MGILFRERKQELESPVENGDLVEARMAKRDEIERSIANYKSGAEQAISRQRGHFDLRCGYYFTGMDLSPDVSDSSGSLAGSSSPSVALFDTYPQPRQMIASLRSRMVGVQTYGLRTARTSGKLRTQNHRRAPPNANRQRVLRLC